MVSGLTGIVLETELYSEEAGGKEGIEFPLEEITPAGVSYRQRVGPSRDVLIG